MVFPAFSWLLLLVAVVLCAVGFYKFSFFAAMGHGLALAGLGLTVLMLALSRGIISLALALACLLCLVYGLFQGVFAALSELLRTAGRRIFKPEAEKSIPLYISLAYWLGMAVLSLLQISPLWYRVSAGVGKDGILAWLGLAFVFLGVLLMLLAGRQAYRQQAETDLPPMSGLYNWIRCPVQLGRMFFALGLFVSGAGYLSGGQWIVALLGLAGAIFLALQSAFKQDRRTRKKYSFLPEYREYVEDTHILMPLMMSRPIDWEEKDEKEESVSS